MANKQNLNSDFWGDKTDVQQYLQMIQDTINRMSSNSSNCKNWALTIVAALLALCVSVNELHDYLYISTIPVFMFWGLDFYYLLQENKFRKHEVEFIKRYSIKDNTWKDLLYSFNISIPQTNKSCALKWHCFKSYSVSLFYPVIIIFICLLSCFIGNRESQKAQDFQTPLQQIEIRQDSIINAMKSFTDNSSQNDSFSQIDDNACLPVSGNKDVPNSQ